jgi:hypothetical protein
MFNGNANGGSTFNDDSGSLGNKKQIKKGQSFKHPLKQHPPRTGIEQPFMVNAPNFIMNHKEFEPIHVMNVSPTNL